MCVCVCACVRACVRARERETERESARLKTIAYGRAMMCEPSFKKLHLYFA